MNTASTTAERPLPTRAYAAYGMTIESDFALPGVREAAQGPGATPIRFIRRPALPTPPTEPFAYRDEGKRQVLEWSEVGSFAVTSNDRVEVEPIPGVADELVALPLLGAVTAALLHRRGAYVLHASAVSVGGVGVALVGDKGAGKSTTAALLLAQGHTLLTDDIVALDFGAGPPRIMPAGSAEMKLWPESVAALPDLGLDRGRTWHGDISKASYSVKSKTGLESVPIGAVYVLSRRADAAITLFQSSQALALLLRFSYQARYGQVGFGDRLAEHFARSGELAAQGLVRRLIVPQGLDRAPEIVAAIEGDLRR